MKKLMLISLFVIPFCKAADPYASWNLAVQNIPDLQQVRYLELSNREFDNLTIRALDVPKISYLNFGNNKLKRQSG